METSTNNRDKALRIVLKQMDEQAKQVKLSEGFADRLMERIRQEERAKKMTLRRRRIGFAVGIAAALALLVGIALHVMHQDTRTPQQAKVKRMKDDVREKRNEMRERQRENLPETKDESRLANLPTPIGIVTEEVTTGKDEPMESEMLSQQSEDKEGERDVCWILIPNTPFALKYSLTWDANGKEAGKANVSAVECVTIEENDTVLIKSPSGEIGKGSMYVYEGEKKENDFVYWQNGRLLTADVRIYYKKAFLNADGQTYSYIDALALLDFPTCSLCMKD